MEKYFYGGYSTLAYKISKILNKFKITNNFFIVFIFSNKGIADNEINLYGKLNDNSKIYSELEKIFANTTYNKIICTSPWAFYISSLYFKQEILYIKGGGLFNVENLHGLHILNTNVDNYLDPLTVKLENKNFLKKTNIDLLVHAHPKEEHEKYKQLWENIPNNFERFDYSQGISTTDIINIIKILNIK